MTKHIKFERRDGIVHLKLGNRISRGVAIVGAVTYSLDLNSKGYYTLEREFDGHARRLTKQGVFVAITNHNISYDEFLWADVMLEAINIYCERRNYSHNLSTLVEAFDINRSQWYKENIKLNVLTIDA